MPCRCDDMETPAQYKQEADKLAALLCSLCEYVEKGGTTHDVENWPASVRKWWKDHKRKDEERRAKEQAEERRLQLRRDALAKLTPEERKVLGV